MKSLKEIIKWVTGHEDVFIDFIRIYLGIGLFIKAIYFIMNKDYLLQLVSDAGDLSIAPTLIAHYVIMAHLGGGVLLALGLLTRIAAAVQIPALIGAVFQIFLPNMLAVEQRQNLEFSALVLVLLILFAIFGSGRFSVDTYLKSS